MQLGNCTLSTTTNWIYHFLPRCFHIYVWINSLHFFPILVVKAGDYESNRNDKSVKKKKKKTQACIRHIAVNQFSHWYKFLQPWDFTELWVGELSHDGQSLKDGTKRKVRCTYIHTYIHTYILNRPLPTGAFQGQETYNWNKLNRLRIPTGRRQTSWLCTSAAEEMNQGLPRTNPASGQSGTWTRASSPAP